MQTPKIKLIKMYVVVASTLGAINVAHAMYDPCLDISGNTAGCNVLSSQSKIHNSVYFGQTSFFQIPKFDLHNYF